jgi:hypothetical protein
MAQFRCVYLGVDVPADDMIAAVRRSRAGALALHVSYVTPETTESLTRICHAVADDLTVWLGGRGAEMLHRDGALPEACPAPTSLPDFLTALNRWVVEGDPPPSRSGPPSLSASP